MAREMEDQKKYPEESIGSGREQRDTEKVWYMILEPEGEEKVHVVEAEFKEMLSKMDKRANHELWKHPNQEQQKQRSSPGEALEVKMKKYLKASRSRGNPSHLQKK